VFSAPPKEKNIQTKRPKAHTHKTLTEIGLTNNIIE